MSTKKLVGLSDKALKQIEDLRSHFDVGTDSKAISFAIERYISKNKLIDEYEEMIDKLEDEVINLKKLIRDYVNSSDALKEVLIRRD